MLTEGKTSETNIKELARELLHLPLAQVVPSNTNPRLNLEKEPFEELKRSILENGLLQPIVVRPLGELYEIIGGHRRYFAIKDLAAAHKEDRRFTRIAVVVVDVEDSIVPVLQLAENLNRSDLSPLEISDALARALDGGVSADRLSSQLGWTRRNLTRYLQLKDAPDWLKEFAREVKVTKKKVDPKGNVVLDKKSNKPLLETERLQALPFTYVIELITLFNVLRDYDRIQLEELGGDAFKPQAERVVRKLAVTAAVEGWTTAKLRAEIKRAKDPELRAAGDTRSAERPAFIITETKVTLDLARATALSMTERAELAKKLTDSLKKYGFKQLLITS